MADDQYLSYEQVLQELQIDRSQLNRLIREGMLKEHMVEGQTRFSVEETANVKATLEKSPTVVDEGAGAPSRTEIMGEPGTELLEGEEAEGGVLREAPSRAAVERDTEILEEGEELELEEEGEEPPAVSESALETDLELEAAPAAAAEEPAKEDEDFFDFSGLDAGDLQLEEAEPEPEVGEPVVQEVEEEEEDIITDVLDLEPGEQVAEEDLLSEIMEIGEEEELAPVTADETEDLTAEITTLEEPTYEESALDEMLEPEHDVDFGAVGEDFEVPYAAPVVTGEGQVSGGWVLVLLLTVILMVLGGIFAVENGSHPDTVTGLTSWMPVGRGQ